MAITVTTSDYRPWYMGSPNIVVMSDGDVYVLSAGYDSGVPDGFFSLYYKTAAGSSFSNIATFYGATIHGNKKSYVIAKPCMQVDSNDIIHIVSYGTAASNTNDIVYRAYNHNTSSWVADWVGIASFSSTFMDYQSPVMVIDSSDDVHVFFIHQNSKSGDLLEWVSNTTGSWSQSTLDGEDGTTFYYPSAVINASNVITVTYAESSSTSGWKQIVRSGGSWGSASGSGSYYWVSPGNSFIDTSGDTFSIGINTTDTTIYYKKNTGTATTTGITDVVTYISAAQYRTQADCAFINGKFVLLYNDSTNGVTHAESDSDTISFTDKNIIGGNSPFICYNPTNPNYGNNIYFTYESSGQQTFDIITPGTSTSDNQYAYLRGSINATPDNQYAYMEGDWNRDSLYAYTKGYLPYQDAIGAWMMGQGSHQPAFLEGTVSIYFDVIPFTAKTSTGNQVIDGDLNGKTPQFAMFMGWDATTNDTENTNLGMFCGFTDGTRQWISRTHFLSGSSVYLYGETVDTDAAGLRYNSKGQADFDNFHADGVTLDWTAGASTAYQCFAFLAAGGQASDVQVYTGKFDTANALANEQFHVNDPGFRPDIVIFAHHTSYNGDNGGMCLGFMSHTHDGFKQGVLGTNWSTGYVNYPICVGSSSLCIWNGYSTDSFYGGRDWYGVEMTSSGFKIAPTQDNPGTYSIYYAAIKLQSPYMADAGLQTVTHYNATQAAVDVGFPPDAVVTFFKYAGWADAVRYKHSIGAGAIDGTHDQTGSIRTGHLGSSWVSRSVVHNSRDMLYYDPNDGAKEAEENFTSLDAAGYTSYVYSSNHVTNIIPIAFGKALYTTGSQNAYLAGHSRFQNAYMEGDTSAQGDTPAFVNVVGAQSQQAAYMEPLAPERSSKSAYLAGYDSAYMVVTKEFTCNTSTGNQSITDTQLNGLTPKAVIFYTFRSTQDAEQTGVGITIGYTDGTSQFCQSSRGKNDTAYYYDQQYSIHDDAVIAINNGTQSTGLEAKASISSFSANTVTINWSDAPPAAYKGVAIIFAGSGVSAKVGYTPTWSDTSDDIVVSSLSFEPDVLFGHIHGAGTNPPYLTVEGTQTQFVCINDGDSYPTQAKFAVQSDNNSGGRISVFRWEGTEGHLNTLFQTTNQIMKVKSFDSNGFTIERDVTYYTGSGWEFHFLALQFSSYGKYKAHIAWPEVPMYEDNNWRNATGKNKLYHVVRDVMVAYINHRWIQDDAYWGGETSQWAYDCASIFFDSPTIHKTFVNSIGADYIDFDTVYEHQITRAHIESTDPYWLEIRSNVFGSSGTWYPYYKAKLTAITDGFKYQTSYIDWDYIPTFLYTPHTFFWSIGLAEYFDSTPAFTHGAIEGKKFLPAFLQGTVSQTSDNHEAYMEGGALYADSHNAYLHGQNNTTGSKQAYTKGLDSYSGQQLCYTVAVEFVKGSTPAFTRSGYDVTASQEAYLAGIPSRSSTQAYLEGFSATPTTSIQCYMNGSSTWPFFDDFLGQNNNPWNTSKWTTTTTD